MSCVKRMKIKVQEALWTPRDLIGLSPVVILTKLQYCSKTACQALYTVAERLSDPINSLFRNNRKSYSISTTMKEYAIQWVITGEALRLAQKDFGVNAIEWLELN